jgi:hypothetical protein
MPIVSLQTNMSDDSFPAHFEEDLINFIAILMNKGLDVSHSPHNVPLNLDQNLFLRGLY